MDAVWEKDVEKFNQDEYFSGGSMETTNDLTEAFEWELDNLAPGEYVILIVDAGEWYADG